MTWQKGRFFKFEWRRSSSLQVENEREESLWKIWLKWNKNVLLYSAFSPFIIRPDNTCNFHFNKFNLDNVFCVAWNQHIFHTLSSKGKQNVLSQTLRCFPLTSPSPLWSRTVSKNITIQNTINIFGGLRQLGSSTTKGIAWLV